MHQSQQGMTHKRRQATNRAQGREGGIRSEPNGPIHGRAISGQQVDGVMAIPKTILKLPADGEIPNLETECSKWRPHLEIVLSPPLSAKGEEEGKVRVTERPDPQIPRLEEGKFA